MVQEEMLVGTGNLPKFGENLFRDDREDLMADPDRRGAGHQSVSRRDSGRAQLPIYHVAYTPCFRREQISAGRDVRGIKRGYQFDKVEMVKFVAPDQSRTEHERLVQEAAEVLEALEMPYRVLQMCTGDLSFTAANKIDLEVWAPGSEEWLEVSSCSNFGDFQARRANSGSARRHRAHPVPAHAERLGAGPAAHDDRDHGELPAPRRLLRHSGGRSALYERHHSHRLRLNSELKVANLIESCLVAIGW